MRALIIFLITLLSIGLFIKMTVDSLPEEAPEMLHNPSQNTLPDLAPVQGRVDQQNQAIQKALDVTGQH